MVKKIDYEDTKEFILNKHYLGRMPSISYAYGLFNDNELCGVLTIGKPASNSLCIGVCGIEYSPKVYELNRLVINNNMPKNTLSNFVGKVLQELKKDDLIIVSYADTGMNHAGYIYQATNWIYTGMTLSRTDKYTEGNKHSRHYNNLNNVLRKLRTAKHRYVYFTGKSKKIYLAKLNYNMLPYPKTNNKYYQLGDKMKTKIINTITGEIFEV